MLPWASVREKRTGFYQERQRINDQGTAKHLGNKADFEIYFRNFHLEKDAHSLGNDAKETKNQA